jgi:hypothetical protein
MFSKHGIRKQGGEKGKYFVWDGAGAAVTGEVSEDGFGLGRSTYKMGKLIVSTLINKKFDSKRILLVLML